MTEIKSKKSFCTKNLEALKTGIAIGFSLCGSATIITGIVMNIINPNMGFLVIPLALQSLLVAIIKKEPRSIEMLKESVKNILKDEDDENVSTFVDEIVSSYTKNTARTNEPIADHLPSARSVNVETAQPQKILMNAYYDAVNESYVITPRI